MPIVNNKYDDFFIIVLAMSTALKLKRYWLTFIRMEWKMLLA